MNIHLFKLLLKDRFAKLKTKPFLVLFAVLFLVLTPLHTTEAFFSNPASDLIKYIIDLPIGIATAAGAFALMLALTIVNLIASLLIIIAGSILTHVMSLNVPMTHCTVPGSGECMVELGLKTTTGFVNIFFVLIFVFIALATILGISKYDWTKTLPKLIGVILLINFAPVICGMVIDVVHVVMQTFIGEAGDFVEMAKNNILVFINAAFKDVLSLNMFKLSGQISLIAKLIVVNMFSICFAAMMMLYALVFLARLIAIWVLVILSPLAFGAWIMPQTNKYFELWMKNFIQWILLGVVLTFFLWLGKAGLVSLGTITVAHGSLAQTVDWNDNQLTDLLNNLIPYIGLLIILGMGFYMGFSTNAVGADKVIGAGKKGLGWAGKKVGRNVGAKLYDNVAPRMQGLAARFKDRGTVGLVKDAGSGTKKAWQAGKKKETWKAGLNKVKPTREKAGEAWGATKRGAGKGIMGLVNAPVKIAGLGLEKAHKEGTKAYRDDRGAMISKAMEDNKYLFEDVDLLNEKIFSGQKPKTVEQEVELVAAFKTAAKNGTLKMPPEPPKASKENVDERIRKLEGEKGHVYIQAERDEVQKDMEKERTEWEGKIQNYHSGLDICKKNGAKDLESKLTGPNFNIVRDPSGRELEERADKENIDKSNPEEMDALKQQMRIEKMEKNFDSLGDKDLKKLNERIADNLEALLALSKEEWRLDRLSRQASPQFKQAFTNRVLAEFGARDSSAGKSAGISRENKIIGDAAAFIKYNPKNMYLENAKGDDNVEKGKQKLKNLPKKEGNDK